MKTSQKPNSQCPFREYWLNLPLHTDTHTRAHLRSIIVSIGNFANRLFYKRTTWNHSPFTVRPRALCYRELNGFNVVAIDFGKRMNWYSPWIWMNLCRIISPLRQSPKATQIKNDDKPQIHCKICTIWKRSQIKSHDSELKIQRKKGIFLTKCSKSVNNGNLLHLLRKAKGK